MRATVPADDLPMHPRSIQRTTLPYRDEAYRILTQSDSIESANQNLNEFLELAVACSNEGDHTEAIMVCLGVTEALILDLDYQAYSEHFVTSEFMTRRHAPPSTREPEGMDAMRVYKFSEVSDLMRSLTSGLPMQHEQKVPCIMALHRLFVMTNPWGPSLIYSLQLILTASTDKDWEFFRSLHDPTVPADTPDWREDPIGFRAAIGSANLQIWPYQKIKDYSLLASYEQRYRDDPGTCIRYIDCLHHMGSKDPRAVIEEAKRLFPDAGFWHFVSWESD